MLVPYALGIWLEDAADLRPLAPLCALSACAVAWLLGARRPAAFGLVVALGATALALRLHAPVPEPKAGPRELVVLASATGAPDRCRLLVFAPGPRPGRLWLEAEGEPCAWRVGQRALAVVELRALRPATNPGGRSPLRHGRRRGVSVAAKVRDGRIVASAAAPVAPLAAWRERLGEAIDPRHPRERGGGLLRVLACGDRSQIVPEVGAAFAASGLAHLLAVSGLHIGWVFALARGAALWLLARSRSARLLRSARPVALAAGLLLAVVYAGLTGAAVPALRAAAMAAAGTVAIVSGRPAAGANALAAAALLVLALEPAALFDGAFALSFTAVAGILVWSPPRGALALVHATVAASAATAPVIASLGLPLPAGALVANAIAVPVFGAVLVPLALASAHAGALLPELSAPAVAAARAAASLALDGVEALRTPDLLAAGVSVRVVSATSLGLFSLRLLVCGRRRSGGFALLSALALLFGARSPAPDPGDWLLALDVGQGDALVAHAGGRSWLIDAGPRFGRFDAGARSVVPALRSLGIERLDVLVVTHADRDHIGGAGSVLARVPVGELWLPQTALAHDEARALRVVAARRGVPVRGIARGDRARIGSARVRVLWPPWGEAAATPNAGSLVLELRFTNGCALLPADVPARVEARLANDVAACQVLKLSHHGSRSSSDPAWLSRLAPWVAVASAGRGARGLFPHPEVRARLHEQAISLYETARTGAVRIRFAAGGLVAEPFLGGAPRR